MNLEHEAEELLTVDLEEGGWLSPTKITIWCTLHESKMDGFMNALSIFRSMPVYNENIAFAAELEQRLLRQLNDLNVERIRLRNKINIGNTMAYNENDVNVAAAVAHAANRQYCITLGDYSQPEWGEAPFWQKIESVRTGVRFLWDNPKATPEDNHAEWLELKRKEGWKYGPVKDPEKKEHPCFLPYDQLPEEQKMKDTIFTTIVRMMQP